MPLFNCSKCGVVENTALGAYWYPRAKGLPVLCSECETGKWHGRFVKSYETIPTQPLEPKHATAASETPLVGKEEDDTSGFHETEFENKCQGGVAQPTQMEQRMETLPIPNPPVRQGARRSPEDEALAFLRANRDTHTRWAEYFEENPEVEAKYLATGVWEGAADQRRLERKYNAAIATFERLAAITRPTVDLGEDGELAEGLGDVLDIIAAAEHSFARTEVHHAYYHKCHEQVQQARDRLERYREAMVEARSWLEHWGGDSGELGAVLQDIDALLSR